MSPPDTPFDEPVFDEPWQAQAFGLTVALHEAGVFDWPAWAQALSTELKAEVPYWQAWLAALERVLAERNLALPDDITAMAHRWEEAAHATPHGQPIALSNARS